MRQISQHGSGHDCPTWKKVVCASVGIGLMLLACSPAFSQDKPITQPYFDRYTNNLVALTKKVVYFNQKRLSAKSPVLQAQMQDSIIKYQVKIQKLK